eukprot:9492011-Pyramimonas_sp.AAC.1
MDHESPAADPGHVCSASGGTRLSSSAAAQRREGPVQEPFQLGALSARSAGSRTPLVSKTKNRHE